MKIALDRTLTHERKESEMDQNDVTLEKVEEVEDRNQSDGKTT